ncbi:MAG TPA: heparinase II/III family protein [Candidatus Brachybacterium merdigallinarum]|nr:heparinase II/III family protein [Candidatus Brachybacterium merdigallinarum]
MAHRRDTPGTLPTNAPRSSSPDRPALSRRSLLAGTAGAAGALSLIVPPAAAAPPAPSEPSPKDGAEPVILGHWDFLSGSTEDLSGHGRHATAGADLQLTADGATFDGSASSVLTIPYSKDYQPESIGIGGRWQVEVTGVIPQATSEKHQALISGRTKTQGWFLAIAPDGEIQLWAGQVTGGDYFLTLGSGVHVQLGGRYDVRGEWDGETFTVSVSGDGEGAASGQPGDRYSGMVDNDVPVRVGFGADKVPDQYFTGSLGTITLSAVPGDTTPPSPDVTLFGSWDEASESWSSEPRLDYEAVPALAPVEEAVRAADYEGARAALLAHFREREDRDTPNAGANDVVRAQSVPLFLDTFWTLGAGDIVQDVVDVPAAGGEVTADVTDAVQRAVSGNAATVTFFLMARVKSEATFSFHSREAASGQPALMIVLEDGSEIEAPVIADTHITAGEDSGTVFGDSPELRVHDEGDGPFSELTSKAFLTVDLGEVTGSPRTATLRLTGSHTGAGSLPVVVYQTLETFDESARTWDNTVQNTFSYQGDPGGFDWVTPPGADTEYGTQITRFLMIGQLVDAYVDTGDEEIAEGLLAIIRDFIADVDTYPTPYGAGSYMTFLDTAARTNNWLYTFERMRLSPSFTGEDAREMLRTLDASGQFMALADNGPPNWLTSSMSALSWLALYFPELRAGAAWIETAGAFLTEQQNSAILPDGGYAEASGWYAYGSAGTYHGLHQRFRDNGYELGGLDRLHALTTFLADQNYPTGFHPAYGDGDSSDRSGSLKSWATFLEDPTLTYRATNGAEGEAPPYTSVRYPDTRVAVLRSDWGEEASYLRINADSGNHAHPDDLAITLFAQGRALLPETGTFSYSSDPRSDWLRFQTESQTTVEVDGTPQTLGAEAGVSAFTSNDVFDLTQLWTDASPGVRHRRTVVFLRPQLWLVGDQLAPEDDAEHIYRQNWHFLPQAAPEILAGSSTATTRFGQGPELWIAPGDGDATAELRDGYHSATFYAVTESTYLSYERMASGPHAFDTLLVVGDDAATSPPAISPMAVDGAPSGTATAGRIDHPDLAGIYCLLHDVDAVDGPVTFGEHSTDARFTHVQDTGSAGRWLLQGGSSLQRDGRDLLVSPTPIPDLAVTFDPRTGTVDIVGSSLVASTDAATAIGMSLPWARTVTLDGAEIPFIKSGALIHAVAAG